MDRSATAKFASLHTGEQLQHVPLWDQSKHQHQLVNMQGSHIWLLLLALAFTNNTYSKTAGESVLLIHAHTVQHPSGFQLPA